MKYVRFTRASDVSPGFEGFSATNKTPLAAARLVVRLVLPVKERLARVAALGVVRPLCCSAAFYKNRNSIFVKMGFGSTDRIAKRRKLSLDDAA